MTAFLASADTDIVVYPLPNFNGIGGVNISLTSAFASVYTNIDVLVASINDPPVFTANVTSFDTVMGHSVNITGLRYRRYLFVVVCQGMIVPLQRLGHRLRPRRRRQCHVHILSIGLERLRVAARRGVGVVGDTERDLVSVEHVVRVPEPHCHCASGASLPSAVAMDRHRHHAAYTLGRDRRRFPLTHVRHDVDDNGRV